jgi:hypothetical protein
MIQRSPKYKVKFNFFFQFLLHFFEFFLLLAYGYVSATASMDDKRVDAYGPVDQNSPQFWAPPRSLVHATYQIEFDRPYTIDNLKINWKVPPPNIELQINSKVEGWKTYLKEKPQAKIDLTFNPLEALGVKILMMDLDVKIEEGKYEDDFYGINKLIIQRPGYPINL